MCQARDVAEMLRDVAEMLRDVADMLRDVADMLRDVTEILRDVTEMLRAVRTQPCRQISPSEPVSTFFLNKKNQTCLVDLGRLG